jgi:hypothetical protein
MRSNPALWYNGYLTREGYMTRFANLCIVALGLALSTGTVFTAGATTNGDQGPIVSPTSGMEADSLRADRVAIILQNKQTGTIKQPVTKHTPKTEKKSSGPGRQFLNPQPEPPNRQPPPDIRRY